MFWCIFTNSLFTLETDIEPGTKSCEISIVVFDVLARQTALVLFVLIGAAQFGDLYP